MVKNVLITVRSSGHTRHKIGWAKHDMVDTEIARSNRKMSKYPNLELNASLKETCSGTPHERLSLTRGFTLSNLTEEPIGILVNWSLREI